LLKLGHAPLESLNLCGTFSAKAMELLGLFFVQRAQLQNLLVLRPHLLLQLVHNALSVGIMFMSSAPQLLLRRDAACAGNPATTHSHDGVNNSPGTFLPWLQHCTVCAVQLLCSNAPCQALLPKRRCCRADSFMHCSIIRNRHARERVVQDSNCNTSNICLGKTALWPCIVSYATGCPAKLWRVLGHGPTVSTSERSHLPCLALP